MAPTLESENRKHTPKQTPTHIDKSVAGSTLKKTSPMEDQWHSWHMPKKASGTQVAAVAQW